MATDYGAGNASLPDHTLQGFREDHVRPARINHRQHILQANSILPMNHRRTTNQYLRSRARTPIDRIRGAACHAGRQLPTMKPLASC